MPGAHQNHSVTPSPQLDRGEEIRWKARGSRQQQGGITHQLPSRTKQTDLGEKREFNSSPIKSEYNNEKIKPNLKTPSPHLSLLPRLSFTPVSVPPPCERHRGMGNWDCSQFITHCLCRSLSLRGRTLHTLLLLQCEVPLAGDSSPQTSPTWVLPTGCSSSQTAPVWVPSTGCSPSGTGCSSLGPPRGHKSCQQTCSGVGSSLHGSAGPASSLLQRRLPTGSQLPSGIHPLRHGVPSTGCRWISAPPWTSMGCRGTTCLTMVFITGCKGKLCSGVLSTFSPSFFTDLGVCRVVSLTSSHSSRAWNLNLFFHVFIFPSFSLYMSANALNFTELSTLLYNAVVCVSKTQFATITTIT